MLTKWASSWLRAQRLRTHDIRDADHHGRADGLLQEAGTQRSGAQGLELGDDPRHLDQRRDRRDAACSRRCRSRSPWARAPSPSQTIPQTLLLRADQVIVHAQPMRLAPSCGCRIRAAHRAPEVISANRSPHRLTISNTDLPDQVEFHETLASRMYLLTLILFIGVPFPSSLIWCLSEACGVVIGLLSFCSAVLPTPANSGSHRSPAPVRADIEYRC